MIPGIKPVVVNDHRQRRLDLLVVVPRGDDIWGTLSCLQDTVWGGQIQVVPGDALSHALHGWSLPLVKVLGVPPLVRAARIPEKEGRCALYPTCLIKRPHCRPGEKTPDCYEAPLDDLDASLRASLVALAWRDGLYVVVVEGKEHSF